MGEPRHIHYAKEINRVGKIIRDYLDAREEVAECKEWSETDCGDCHKLADCELFEKRSTLRGRLAAAGDSCRIYVDPKYEEVGNEKKAG